MPSFDLWQRQPPAACNTPAYCRYAGKHKVLHPADLKSACKLPRLLKKFFFVDIAPSSLRLCHLRARSLSFARTRVLSFICFPSRTRTPALALFCSFAPTHSRILSLTPSLTRPLALRFSDDLRVCSTAHRPGVLMLCCRHC